MTEQRATVQNDEEIKRRARHEFLAWIDHILLQRKQDATGLARDSHLSPSTLLRLMNSKDYQYLPSLTTLKKIASGSGYPIPGKLMEAYEVKLPERHEDDQPRSRQVGGGATRPASFVAQTARAARMIAVRHVSTLPSSLAPMIRSEAKVEVPPTLADDETAFAFKMPDDTLAPAVKAGALVYAIKTRDPAKEDVVLLVDKDGKGKVRIIEGVSEAGYQVSRGGDANETISFDDIADFGIVEIMHRR